MLIAVASVLGITSFALILGAVLGFHRFVEARSRAENIGELADTLLTGGIIGSIRDVAIGWRTHPELQRLILAGIVGAGIALALFALILK